MLSFEFFLAIVNLCFYVFKKTIITELLVEMSPSSTWQYE